MKARADNHRRAMSRPRLTLDRAWVARIALLFVVACGLLLFAHVAKRMFASGGNRIERFEQAGHIATRAPAVLPAVGTAP